MALEDNVAALTDAVKALTAALIYQTTVVQTAAGAEAPKPKVEKSAPVAKKEVVASTTSTAVEEPVTEEVAEEVEVEETTAEEAPEVTLEQLAAKFTDLVEKNRDAAVGLLGEFGIAKLGKASVAQYGAIYLRTEELLANG